MLPCVIPFSFDYILKDKTERNISIKYIIFLSVCFLYQYGLFDGKFKTSWLKCNLKSSQNTVFNM